MNAIIAGIIARVRGEPVLTYELIKGALLAADAFGLPISPDQKVALGVLIIAALSWYTRGKVTPNTAPTPGQGSGAA